MSSKSAGKGAPTTPLSTQVDAFLGHCTDRNLSLATLEAYDQMLHRFIEFMQDHHPEVTSMVDVQATHVQAFRRWLRQRSARAGQEISATTQAKYLAAIRSLLRYCSIEQGLAVMRREAVRLPEAKDRPRARQRRLTAQDVASLLVQPDTLKVWGLRDRAIIALLSETGMRVSGMCALNRRDAREDLLGKHPNLELAPPTGDESVRLGTQTQQYLKEYLAARVDRYPPLFIRHKPGKSQEQDDGQHRLTRQMVDRMLARYARTAGLAFLPSARDFVPPYQSIAS